MKFTVQSNGVGVVRATVPLGSMKWEPNVCPFRVMGPSGPCVTQWERVVAHPGDSDSVGLCEILALADDVGTFTLEPVATPTPDKRAIALHEAKTWSEKAPELWLDGSSAPLIQRPDMHRAGPVALQRHYSNRLMNVWTMVFHGTNVCEVIVDFNRGEIQSAPLFFDTLLLKGPFSGYATEWTELCELTPEGDLLLVPKNLFQKHALQQRNGRPFRIVVWWGANAEGYRAQALADDNGTGLDDGWQSFAGSGSYGAQELRFPSLVPPATKTKATNLARAAWALAQQCITGGLSWGVGVAHVGQPPGPGVQGCRQDWMHPWGGFDGGQTSGSWRWIIDRMAVYFVLSGGETDAIRELRARAWGIAQRMPSLLLDHGGSIAELEGYVDNTGKPLLGWRMASDDSDFDKAGGKTLDGPFGFAAVKAPTEFDAYQPLNWQHFCRVESPLTALVWFTNDPWAAWRLKCYAELWRMSMFSGKRLVNESASVEATPHRGTSWGRAHGHCWAMAAAAFAIGGRRWQQRWAATLHQAYDTIRDAQMPNGLFRASMATSKDSSAFPGCWDDVHNKPLHKVTKMTEESQLANACRALSTQLRGKDEPKVTPPEVLLWAMSQEDFLGCAFWNWVAVANVSGVPYMGVPPLMHGVDKTEVGCGIGFARELVDADPSLDMSALVAAYTGSAADPLGALWARPLDLEPGCDDWIPLAAALE